MHIAKRHIMNNLTNEALNTAFLTDSLHISYHSLINFFFGKNMGSSTLDDYLLELKPSIFFLNFLKHFNVLHFNAFFSYFLSNIS